MHSTSGFARRGRNRSISIKHNMLTDRATITVEGEVVPNRLKRRAFSSLFRYCFTIDDTPLEARMRPVGIHGHVVFEIAPPDAPMPASKIGVGQLAAMSLGMAIMIVVFTSGMMPLAWSASIAAVSATVTFGITCLVYMR